LDGKKGKTKPPSMMSTSSRFPRRKAAEEAMNRIHDIFHPTVEVKNVSTGATLVPDIHQQKYQGSILYLNHLLHSIEQEIMVERKKKYLNKFLKHLLCDPTILIYEPQFRFIVEQKLDEIEQQLHYYHLSFRSTQLLKKMKKMRQSILTNISHNEIRTAMVQKMNEVTGLMITYQHWAKSSNLQNLVKSLRTLLSQLKNHPEYIQ
jgi:hypothetical protein